jgi:hypothetical protein
MIPSEAENEARHHRLREEVRDPAHPGNAERHVEDGRRQRESRGPEGGLVRPEGGGADDPGDGRGRDGGDRSARTLHHLARGAEDGIRDQGGERGVEAVLDRDAGDRRVGQTLRDQQRPDREARDRVRREPLLPVPGKPRDDRQVPLQDPWPGDLLLRDRDSQRDPVGSVGA